MLKGFLSASYSASDHMMLPLRLLDISSKSYLTRLFILPSVIRMILCLTSPTPGPYAVLLREREWFNSSVCQKYDELGLMQHTSARAAV